MKKSVLFLIAVLSILVSCSKESSSVQNDTITPEETTVQEPAEEMCYLTAVFEKEQPSSKANIADDGAFSWSNGDAIAVFNSTDNKYYLFVTDAENGATSAKFSRVAVPGSNWALAYYPASVVMSSEEISAGVSSERDNSTTVTLPASYSSIAVAERSFAMKATVSGSSLYFEHLGSMLRFTANRVPKDANKVEVVFSKAVTGNFTVSKNGSTDKDEIVAGTGSGAVSISFTPGESGSKTFSVPIPVVAGTTLTINFKNRYAGTENLFTLGPSSSVSFDRKSLMGLNPFNIPVSLYINSSKPWGNSKEYAYLSDDIQPWPGTEYTPDTKPFTHGESSYSRVVLDISAAGSSSNIIVNVNYSDSGDSPWYDPYGKLYRAEIPSVDLSTDVYMTISTNTDGTHKVLLRNRSHNLYMDYFYAWYDSDGSTILGAFPGTSISSLSSIVYDSESFPYFTATANKKIGAKAVYAPEKDWNQTNNGYINSLDKNYLITFKNNSEDIHAFGFPDVSVTID